MDGCTLTQVARSLPERARFAGCGAFKSDATEPFALICFNHDDERPAGEAYRSCLK